jgi:hypothetical protein
MTHLLLTRVGAIALATACVANGYLLYQHRRVVIAFGAQQVRLSADAPRPGETIPSLTGVTLEGRRATVPVGSTPQAALVYSTSGTCPECAKSLPSLVRLAADAAHRGLTVVWVSRDDLEEALESGYFANVPGTVICEPTYSTYRAMHLQVVPIVTLVSRTGVVLHSWLGQLDSEREQEIRLALDTPE